MSMRLSELLRGVIQVDARLDRAIQDLSLDSSTVTPGSAFVALRGSKRHGIEFAAEAVARGATIVLAEAPLPEIVQLDAPVLVISELRARLGMLAARFFGSMQEGVSLIGVTGTNGKTSTVQMIAQALTLGDEPCGTIGTLGIGLFGALAAGERTTPDVVEVHRAIADMCDAGAACVAMEVTSHALMQGRVDNVWFGIAAFTNLTRDHLDYHGDMQAYAAAKAKLFAWPSLRVAVINMDDELAPSMVATRHPYCSVIRVGTLGEHLDIKAKHVLTDARGLRFALVFPGSTWPVSARLIGRFNVSNMLVVAGVLRALGWDPARIAGTLSQLDPVPGRMSRLGGDGRMPLVVIDYAHTPDALEKALATLREHAQARLIVVFGCGGERDSGKRPQMAAIAERLADVVIVTDDNPRQEDGNAIVADIRRGFAHPQRVLIERDRKRAIADAIATATPEDVVLIAGKGHEPYQEIGGVRLPFDDVHVAASALREAA